MPVRLRCQCGQSLALPQQKAGLRVQCPVCGEYLTIPESPAASAADLVTTATNKVHAEIAAAIAGEAKAKVDAPTAAPKKVAKERPLSAPPSKPPVPAPPRPEPRAAAPRAAPQPPPRKPKGADEAKTPTTAKSAPQPPPLPVAKYAASEPPAPPSPPPLKPAEPEPATPPLLSVAAEMSVAPRPETAAPRRTSGRWLEDLRKAATALKQEGQADGAEPIRGVEHDPSKRTVVYQLGFGLAALALASTYPAVMEIVRHVRDPLSPGIENWTYVVLLVCGIQLAYALYLVQLPDWSSVWVTMIVTSIVATFYAVGMGMSLMAQADNEVIAMLGLTQWHAGGYLSLWCFLLTLLTALLSYAMVRTSLKWHKLFELAVAHAKD